MTTPNVFTEIPGKSEEGAFVYVIQFSSGVVKVGYTRNPAQRLKQHADAAKRHGGGIAKYWVSQPHAQANENERCLIGPGLRRRHPLRQVAALRARRGAACSIR
jgi:hypothetical protein